jgi:hypothetical protein
MRHLIHLTCAIVCWLVIRDKQVLFRFGYVFLAPREWIDTYAMLHNRPCSTFHRPKVRGGPPLDKLERMVVRLMPQQPISYVDTSFGALPTGSPYCMSSI